MAAEERAWRGSTTRVAVAEVEVGGVEEGVW
jgi:hypothetical protein